MLLAYAQLKKMSYHSQVQTPAEISHPLTLLSRLIRKKSSQRKMGTRYFLVVSLSLSHAREQYYIIGETLVLYLTTTVSMCWYSALDITSLHKLLLICQKYNAVLFIIVTVGFLNNYTIKVLYLFFNGYGKLNLSLKSILTVVTLGETSGVRFHLLLTKLFFCPVT